MKAIITGQLNDAGSVVEALKITVSGEVYHLTACATMLLYKGVNNKEGYKPR
ncbi:MAG: hypothetical protein QXN87_04785 [Candidatus Bathyarchaeia archaeon]